MQHCDEDDDVEGGYYLDGIGDNRKKNLLLSTERVRRNRGHSNL